MTALPPSPAASRRSVLLGGVGATVAATLAACGRPAPAQAPPSSRASAAAASPYVGDLRWVALVAALENLAVTAYASVRTRAAAGDYGTVPPAVETLLSTALQQHRDHAGAWNRLLTKAGRPAVTGRPLRGAQALTGPLTAATTIRDLSTAAVALESSLAQTCLVVVGSVTDLDVVGLAAGIAPVEGQHAAVLRLFLGTAPAPQSTLPTAAAVSPDALTV